MNSISSYKSVLHKIFNLQFQNFGNDETCRLLIDQFCDFNFVGISSLHIKYKKNKKSTTIVENSLSDKMNGNSVNLVCLEEITNKVLTNKCPLCYRDVSNLPSFLDSSNKDLDSRSLLSVPLGLGESIFGVAHFISHKGKVFSIEQMNFLLTLGYIISLTLIKLRFSKLENYDNALVQQIETKCRSLIENEYDLVIEVSMDGTFLYVNERHENVLGYRPDDLTGLNIFKYIHPEDVSEVVRVFSRGMGALTPEDVKFRYRNSKGFWQWLESIGTPYRIINGNVRAIVASREIEVDSSGEN